ncbi:MAG TPA: toll/interleukin-1 receptor domain-containing protein [Anaerolineales bacterium]|nr:toll/interleukin-1 receptor domain-containing protein [Anaerolineales bacterium]
MAERKLRVFLCHAQEDKKVAQDLYKQLAAEPWIDPWIDKEHLLPGQDWKHEIEKAQSEADVIVVALSSHSVTKDGFVRKELSRVLEQAAEKPEDEIFIIPLRLDESPVPPSLANHRRIDLANDPKPLINALKVRANFLLPGTSTTDAPPPATKKKSGRK